MRFLDLVPIEYDRGTEDGRVTVDFEIQEAVAFQEGAASAFSDLEGELSRARPARHGRGRVRHRSARHLRRGGPGGRARRLAGADGARPTGSASDTLEELIPEEWTLDDSQSDFDLIALTLDRLETAVGAGQYQQAEQARLEAYAFFEFGPELSLRSIAPDITARVEGLVWFGADGEEGLATLIADKKPRSDVHATRLALDQALEDGAGALGDGASGATVVTNAAVIVFREGLEAVLILAAVMASLSGAARLQRRPMMIGALLAILASIITYVLARTVLTELAQYGEKLEAIVGLVAIAVLLLVLNWFFHKVYWTDHIKKFNKRRRRLLSVAGGGLISAQVLGFVLLGFSTIYREGFETVLFLQALELNSGLAVVVEGVLLGGIAVGAVAIATFKLERKLPYKKMLIVTGVLLTVVLAIMVGKTVRTMQGVGWLPITPIDVEMPYWTGIWLGVFPTVETIVAQVASLFFVLGSYWLAERMKHRPRGRPVPAASMAEAPPEASRPEREVVGSGRSARVRSRPAGSMFWLTRKTLSGSYVALMPSPGGRSCRRTPRGLAPGPRPSSCSRRRRRPSRDAGPRGSPCSTCRSRPRSPGRDRRPRRPSPSSRRGSSTPCRPGPRRARRRRSGTCAWSTSSSASRSRSGRGSPPPRRGSRSRSRRASTTGRHAGRARRTRSAAPGEAWPAARA